MSGYIGNIPTPQATQSRQSFTATAAQTTFNTLGYSPGYLDVYLNGVHLLDGTDYTATNGSDIVLTTGAALNDVVEFVAYETFSVLDQSFTGTTTVDVLSVTGAATGTDLTLSGGVYLGGAVAANYLDDYEEGTWTPTVEGSAVAGTSTYSTREGSYVKIGRQVTVTCSAVLASFSGASGDAVVVGLPFVAASNYGVATGTFECDNVAFSAGYTSAYVIVFGAQSQVSYRQHGSSKTEAPIPVAQVPAGNWQRFSVTYFTDA